MKPATFVMLGASILLFVVARCPNSALVAAAPVPVAGAKKDGSSSGRGPVDDDDACSSQRLLSPGGALANALTCKPAQLCFNLLAQLSREKNIKLDARTGLAGFCEAACDLQAHGCNTTLVLRSAELCEQPMWVIRRSVSIPGAVLCGKAVCDGQVVFGHRIWTMVPSAAQPGAVTEGTGSPQVFVHSWLMKQQGGEATNMGGAVLFPVGELSYRFQVHTPGGLWLSPPGVQITIVDPPVIIRGTTCLGKRCYGG